MTPLAPLEGVTLWSFGHSFLAGSGSPIHMASRVALRNHMQQINKAVAGNTMGQTLATIQAQWVVDAPRTLVLLCSMVNDSNGSIASATVAEAFRSCLAYLTAKVVLPYTDTGFAFGSGWTTGATSTANSYVDLGWTGDTAHLLVDFVTGAGGSFTITNSGSGTPAQTINTGGYAYAFTGAVRLSGYGAGAHTVRIKVASGSVQVRAAAVLGDTPPPVVWLQEGALPSYDAVPAKQTLLTSTYPAALAPVAATFPTVIAVPAGSGWNEASMTSVDAVHPNDKGMSYYADQILAALAALLTTFRQGLNTLTQTLTQASATYVPTTPSWSASPTVPDAVIGLTVTPGDTQLALAWTAPSSNGSTITNYKVYRSTTSGAETLVTTLGNVTSYTDTGRTNSTTYYYKVTAVNGIGEGPLSSEVSGVPSPVTVPGAPTSVTATALIQSASVAFTAPASNGGSAITSYTVTSSPGGITRNGTVSPITVLGLDGGTAYTFTVTATNAVGTGSASSASNSVTPAAPTVADKFNRADSSSIGTPDTGAYAASSGMGINGNRAAGITGFATNYAYGTAASADHTVTIKMAAQSNDRAWIMLGAVDVSNHYAISMKATAVQISKIVSGSSTLILQETTTGVAAGDIVQATISGTGPRTITVKVNGVQVISTTDSTFTTGNHGGYAIFHNDPCYLDDFSLV